MNEDEANFKVECRNLKSFLQKTAPPVATYFEKEWEVNAEHWARWGRTEVKELQSDTNNLIEAFFRKLKYGFARRRVRQRMEDLIKLIVFEVMPHYLIERIRKVCGISTSTASEVDKRRAEDVEWLKRTPAAVMFFNDSTNEAMASSTNTAQAGKSYRLCVGELSCECPANQHAVCKHVIAASSLRPLTLQVLQATAPEIISRQQQDKLTLYT